MGVTLPRKTWPANVSGVPPEAIVWHRQGRGGCKGRARTGRWGPSFHHLRVAEVGLEVAVLLLEDAEGDLLVAAHVAADRVVLLQQVAQLRRLRDAERLARLGAGGRALALKGRLLLGAQLRAAASPRTLTSSRPPVEQVPPWQARWCDKTAPTVRERRTGEGARVRLRS